MNVPQEAFSTEEGIRVQKKLLRSLNQKYGVCRVEEAARVLAWSHRGIHISVPGTPRTVSVWLERRRAQRYDATYGQTLVRVGDRRWQKLEWQDGEWHFERKKLFKKIDEEILKLKGEYVTQQAEKNEMETNRTDIAARLGLKPDAIRMKSPFTAIVQTGWGHLNVGFHPGKVFSFSLWEIHISKVKDFPKLTGMGMERLLESLNSVLESENE